MYPDPQMHDPPSDLALSSGKQSWWDKVDLPVLNRRSPKYLVRVKRIVICLMLLFVGNVVYTGAMAARRSASKCTLSILGLTFHNYESAKGSLPPHTTTDPSGMPLHGWLTHMLPSLEQTALHARIDFGKPWDHPHNAPLFKTRIGSICYCGVDPDVDPHGFPLTTYSANSHVFKVNSGISFKEIVDGTSVTLFVGEISEALPPWGKPGNVRDPALGLNRGPDTFGGPFEGYTQFVLADGSVQSYSNNIDPKILKALATPAGGEGCCDFR